MGVVLFVQTYFLSVHQFIFHMANLFSLCRDMLGFLLVHLLPQFAFKGTNGRQKTYEISHVYSIFYSGFMCQTTVIFGIRKDGSLY